MKKYICNLVFFFLILCSSNYLYGQDPWKLSADKPDSNNYYGETVANGMIGIISSPEPLKVKEVVLAGTYDIYKRGGVSSFIPNYKEKASSIGVFLNVSNLNLLGFDFALILVL